MLKYEDLKHRPKELLAATGLKQNEFEALLAAIEKVAVAMSPLVSEGGWI